MLADSPGDGVGDVAGDVVTARGGRGTDGVKAIDDDVWRAGKRGAGIQACEGKRVLGVVQVGEPLGEVADPGGNLIGEVGTETVVPDHIIVRDMRRDDLKVLGQEGAAGRLGVTLAQVVAARDMALVAEVVVELGDHIVTVAALRRAGGVVEGCAREVGDQGWLPERAEDVLGDLAGGDAEPVELGESQCHVRGRRLGGGVDCADEELLLLVAEEQEGVILPDRAAE